MNGKPTPWQIALLFILAVLLSLYALLFHQARSFSFTHHDFHPAPAALALLTAVFFVLLLSVWILYSRWAAGLFRQVPAAVLEKDFLSFLPALFLSLAPLTLGHYIGAADLRARLSLFLLAVGGAFLYLKIISAREWAAGDSSLWAGWLTRFQARSLPKRITILFAAAVILFNAGSLVMIYRGATFSGDEPHYLIISHSLLYDGDFDLANNYAQKDYARYMLFSGEISPHVVVGAKPESRYSFHSPGISLLLLPFYALGSLFPGKAFAAVIRLGMSLWGALFAVQIYLLARRRSQNENPALGLWFLAAFTAPVFFYAIHVYPEIVVAFLALAVYRLLQDSPSLSAGRVAVCGLFLGSFIWFHALKYLALFAPLFLYGLWTVRRKAAPRSVLLLYILVPAVVIFLYLQFQHALYGTYSLFAVSWARTMTAAKGGSLGLAGSLLSSVPIRGGLETLAGYFLDQRDGLLFYSPLYLFSFFGAWEMFRKKRQELLLLLFLGMPYVLLSAFLTQRSGYAPQARPLVAVIWVMIIALGYFLRENRATFFAYLKNFAVSVSLVFVALLLSQPLNLYQETTRGVTQRGGGLFYLLSNLHFDLTRFLPSYLKVEDRSWLPNLVWPALLAVFVLAYALSKKKPIALGFSRHVGLACAGVAVCFVWLALYPRLVVDNPTRVKFPSGDRVTFYSLSRSAKWVEDGRFLLREDGRAYRFYLTTDRPIAELGFDFGSEYGDYDCSLRLFGEPLIEERTVRDIRSFKLDQPPRYRLGRKSLYEIILELGRGTIAMSDLTPYQFAIHIRTAPD